VENRNKSPAKVLMSVTEISEIYGLSKYTIRRFISEGLPVIHCGRKIYIHIPTFEKYIKGGKDNE
jgi:hypothetical protein